MSADDNRWLPPSPHREEVLRRIEAGRAHIQERGHNMPPLLVFEDGGVIELPRVRYEMTHRGMELVSSTEDRAEGQTKHNDVCGSIDEIKGMLKEQPEASRERPEPLIRLLDDAEYMLGRMKRRWDAYVALADMLADSAARMNAVVGPDVANATEKAAKFREVLSQSTADLPVEQLDGLVEGVRDVANGLEQTLRAHKEIAIEVSDHLDALRGGRKWKRPEEASAEE